MCAESVKGISKLIVSLCLTKFSYKTFFLSGYCIIGISYSADFKYLPNVWFILLSHDPVEMHTSSFFSLQLLHCYEWFPLVASKDLL